MKHESPGPISLALLHSFNPFDFGVGLILLTIKTKKSTKNPDYKGQMFTRPLLIRGPPPVVRVLKWRHGAAAPLGDVSTRHRYSILGKSASLDSPPKSGL